ncbi:hypothetical protein SOASR029_25210 [Budvicia aquatica]|nr:hypothetical protein SOASR029_25210 [Budvicia aquatica]
MNDLTLEPHPIKKHSVFNFGDVKFETYILSVEHLVIMLDNAFVLTSDFFDVIGEGIEPSYLNDIKDYIKNTYGDRNFDPWNNSYVTVDATPSAGFNFTSAVSGINIPAQQKSGCD